MKNAISDGKFIAVAAPAAVASGAGVLVGSLFGVAVTDAASGAQVTIATEGEYSLPKVAAQEWTVGAKIYWNDTAKNCTTAASGNTLIGVATDVTVNPSDTGPVRLGLIA